MCSTVGIRGASFWMNMAYKDAFSWCLTRLIYRSKKYGDLKTSCGSWLEATKRFHSWTELPDCFHWKSHICLKIWWLQNSLRHFLLYFCTQIRFPPNQTNIQLFARVRADPISNECFSRRWGIVHRMFCINVLTRESHYMLHQFTLHHNLYRYIYIHGWRQMDR